MTSRAPIACIVLTVAACTFTLPEPREPRDPTIEPPPEGVDASKPDAARGEDASTEAAAPRYCTTVSASFCEDFEQQLTDSAYEQRTTGGGTFLVENGGFRAKIPALTDARAWAYVKRAFTAPVTNGARLEMTVTLEEAPASGNQIMIAPVTIGSPWFVALLVLPNLSVLLTERTDATTFVDHGPAGSMPVGRPTRITLEVTLSPSNVTVTIDGKETKNEALSAPPAPAAPALQFGISNAEPPGGPWKMLFDDVRFDLR